MTQRASDIAARFHASATNERPAMQTPQQEPPAAALTDSAIQRFMVNMPKSQHRFIRQFALELDSDASTIIRTLLTMIQDDPVFAEQLRNRLRGSK